MPIGSSENSRRDMIPRMILVHTLKFVAEKDSEWVETVCFASLDLKKAFDNFFTVQCLSP